jgi:hypothetical protein
MSAEAIVCKCNGTGRLTYEHKHDPVEYADGTIVEGRTHGTHPCPCRSSLPPRDGEAAWWSLELVHQDVFDGPLATAEITVEAEVPYDSENYKVHRRGNRYYCTGVRIDVDGGFLHLLNPEEAQKFAEAVKRAADVAEAIDEQDSDPCGHWHPCDCQAAAPRKLVGSDREENR